MKQWRTGVAEWIKDFGKALIFFLVLQTYFVQGFVIEGACMEPEMHTREKILVNKFLYLWRDPRPGEVVVFTFPLDPKKDFVKRVVGVPGDLLEIRDGYLHRNGERMEESYVKEYIFGTFGPVRVPPGKLCVMGDNRNNSHDSRTWGFLDSRQVKGRAEVTFWPFRSMGRITTRER